MNWLDRLNSLFLMALAALIFFSSIQLGLGNLRKPGAGFIPFLASVLVFCLSDIVLLTGTKRHVRGEKKTGMAWGNAAKMMIMVIALALYISMLKTVGYLLSDWLLMFLMFLIFNPRKWYFHIVSAILVSGVSFAIFRGLGVQLPTGIFSLGW